MLKNIMVQRSMVQQVGGWDKFMKHGQFSIHAAYSLLAPVKPTVPWSSIIVDNKEVVGVIFLFVSYHGKGSPPWTCYINGVYYQILYTTYAIGIQKHLFMECLWSCELKKAVLGMFEVPDFAMLQKEVNVMSKRCKKERAKGKVLEMLWSEFVYELWLVRCRATYQNLAPHVHIARSTILLRIVTKCKDKQLSYLCKRV